MSTCPICLAPLWADDDAWCPYCGQPMDEGGRRYDYRGPYDDEGDLAYSDVAGGEDAAPAVPPALNNPAYPLRPERTSAAQGGPDDAEEHEGAADGSDAPDGLLPWLLAVADYARQQC